MTTSQIIYEAIASPPHGKNFREVLAAARAGISPHQMVQELRALKREGLIYFDFDPKHKRRFLYFPVTTNAQENQNNN